MDAAFRPRTESQARELLTVPHSGLHTVVRLARERAGEGAITAGHFRAAVHEYYPVKAEPPTKSATSRSLPKSMSQRKPAFGYDTESGHIIMSYGGAENADMISLAGFIRLLGVPERDLYYAMRVCYREEASPDIEDRNETQVASVDALAA